MATLENEGTLLFDGAFGTYYASLPAVPDEARDHPELACLLDPEEVVRIHRDYIDSGAAAVKTNTYGVNRRLTGDTGRRDELLRQGYALAARAAEGTGALVFADIGPVEGEDAPEAQAEYAAIADVLLRAGATRFLFETLPEAAPCGEAFRRIRETTADGLIIASFAVTRDGYTRRGRHYLELFAQAAALGADVVGLNCVCGPAHMLELLRRVEPGRYRLSAMPNAGYPSTVNGRCVYLDNPAYFAGRIRELRDSGVQVLGGCCGTTPRHIRAAADSLRDGGDRTAAVIAVEKPRGREPTPSPLEACVHPVVAVELPPPTDGEAGFLLDACRRLKARGADFVTLPDSPMAKPRASSLMTAGLCRRETGIEVLPHLCCRDRNQIAIKGDLLAGSLFGVRHVLAITGDAVPETDRFSTKNVFGLNSWQLIRFIASLNEELFPETPYYICAALNINAANFSQELCRAERKLENGARCLITQPLFSDRGIANFRQARQALSCRLLAGIMPVAGYRNAVFLNNEVPGIEIPDTVVGALRDKGREEARDISLRYCAEIIGRVRDACDGYYIMTPLRRIDLSEAVVRTIRNEEEAGQC